MVRNGNGCKNPRKSLVAATFEKANTYVFAALIIRDREVGGSNPLAPTNHFKHLRLPVKVAVLVLWQDCGRALVLPLRLRPVLHDPLRECSVASFADQNVP